MTPQLSWNIVGIILALVISAISAILQAMGWIRRNKLDSDKEGASTATGTERLVSAAYTLSEGWQDRLDDTQEELDVAKLKLESAQKMVDHHKENDGLRIQIEIAEREMLEDQCIELRTYSQTLIGLLARAGVEDIPSPGPLPTRTLTVLIVNSDPDMCDRLKSLAPLYAHKVVTASTLEDAREILRTVQIDAVVVEWGLPHNGATLYKTVRSSGQDNRVVVLIVSGSPAGLTAYTPINIDAAIETVLERRKH